jgi:hypothetical protein
MVVLFGIGKWEIIALVIIVLLVWTVRALLRPGRR